MTLIETTKSGLLTITYLNKNTFTLFLRLFVKLIWQSTFYDISSRFRVDMTWGRSCHITWHCQKFWLWLVKILTVTYNEIKNFDQKMTYHDVDIVMSSWCQWQSKSVKFSSSWQWQDNDNWKNWHTKCDKSMKNNNDNACRRSLSFVIFSLSFLSVRISLSFWCHCQWVKIFKLHSIVIFL